MPFDLRVNNVVTFTPLAGYTIPNMLRLLAQNRFHVSPRYTARFAYSVALSSLMTPFYIKERLAYDKAIAQTQITKDPVFIIGFWRCGTTLLHNLFASDPQFGFLTSYQALVPALFISGEKTFKPIVVSSLPKKRPQDDGDLGADLPQEDIYALGALTPYSYYHGWCFPRGMERYNAYSTMEHASATVQEDWQQAYLTLLKKITMYYKGRQLVLKNQDNTAKIPQLLEMFPDAKFVFCYRNPYTLYMSMMKFMYRVLPLYCVQTPPSVEWAEEQMMDLFKQMTLRYLEEKDRVPAGNLAEVRYEAFLRQPLRTIRDLYAHLGLEGYAAVESTFKTYLQTQKSVKIDSYAMTDGQRQVVEDRWGFAFKQFRYRREPRNLTVST